jgi:uncharacterized protein
MSPRIKKIRKVLSPPAIKGMKPYGGSLTNSNAESVSILFEEYEALRLCDYDMYNHHQASLLMGVSRPTFTRIYASARQKVVLAIVEGRQISIEGGKVYFDSDWYKCFGCGCYFNHPDKENKIEACPLCGSSKIAGYDPRFEGVSSMSDFCTDICICPSCGAEKEHQPGKPCSQVVCAVCNTRMRRHRSPHNTIKE